MMYQDRERQTPELDQQNEAPQIEREEPAQTRYSSDGPFPPVENQTAQSGPSASERAYGKATVTARGLNVRSDSSTSSKILGVLHRGDVVEEIGRSNGWVQISYGGGNAFVHSHYVTSGATEGKPPSAEGQAEAMQMFAEVNGGPTQGKAPSAEGQAEAMQMFAEVNGGPTQGKAPSAEGQAEAMQMFAEVNGGPTQGKAPSAEGQAEAMQMFAEVNGGPTQGKAPSAEGQAEAMQMFAEVNGGPTQGKAPSAEGRAEAMQMFTEVNGGPTMTEEKRKQLVDLLE